MAELKGRFIWTLPREGEGGQTDHCPHLSDITTTKPFFEKDLFSQQIYIFYFIHQSCPWERRNVWNYCFRCSWSLMWLLLHLIGNSGNWQSFGWLMAIWPPTIHMVYVWVSDSSSPFLVQYRHHNCQKKITWPQFWALTIYWKFTRPMVATNMN